jgi:uncharacterized cofD-like protein
MTLAGTPAVVALGGGHGLAASLSALRRVTDDLTGIVTVADNGGSSGRLRDEFGILPPGDLRNALAALSADDDRGRTWARVLQHRFDGGGPLAGHALGNLLIAAVWDLLDGPVAGLDLIGELLGSCGRVLPMAAVPLDIEADVLMQRQPEQKLVVRGQAEVATAEGRVLGIRLDPPDPPACDEAVDAVRAADWVVVGPGSWFTSVMPTLMVPRLRRALVGTAARRVLVLNLQGDREISSYAPREHLEILAAHAPDLHLDVVVSDLTQCDDAGQLETAANELGARLVAADLALAKGSDQHDPAKLAPVFAEVFGGVVAGA